MNEKTHIKFKKCLLYFDGGRIVIKDQSSYVNRKGISVTIGAHAKIISDDKQHTITLPLKDYVSIPKACEAIEQNPKVQEFIEKIGGHKKLNEEGDDEKSGEV